MNVLDAIAVQRIARGYAARTPKRPLVESVLRNAGLALSENAVQPKGVYAFTGRNLSRLIEASLDGEPPAEDVGAAVAYGGTRRDRLAFHGAPVGLICTMARGMDPADLLEHGGFIYAISLAASEFGLAATKIGEFHGLDDRLRSAVGFDPQMEQISVGIALGYPEEGRPHFHDQALSAAAEALRWH